MLLIDYRMVEESVWFFSSELLKPSCYFKDEIEKRSHCHFANGTDGYGLVVIKKINYDVIHLSQ